MLLDCMVTRSTQRCSNCLQVIQSIDSVEEIGFSFEDLTAGDERRRLLDARQVWPSKELLNPESCAKFDWLLR
jgi:hypothetical protein